MDGILDVEVNNRLQNVCVCLLVAVWNVLFLFFKFSRMLSVDIVANN